MKWYPSTIRDRNVARNKNLLYQYSSLEVSFNHRWAAGRAKENEDTANDEDADAKFGPELQRGKCKRRRISSQMTSRNINETSESNLNYQAEDEMDVNHEVLQSLSWLKADIFLSWKVTVMRATGRFPFSSQVRDWKWMT